VRQHPVARHVIVAHSHGGTVSLLALRDPVLASSIDALVCLGTPFPLLRLRSSWRKSPEAVWRRRGFFAILAALWCWAGAIGLLQLATGAMPTNYWILAAVSSAFTAMGLWLCSLAGPGARVGARAMKYLQLRARAYIDRFQLPPLVPVRTLVVHGPGDEASGALAASHFLGWMLAHARSIMRKLLFLLIVVSAIFFARSEIANPEFLASGRSWMFQMALSFGIAVVLLFLIAWSVAAFIVPGVQAITLGLAWLFGWDYLPWVFAVEVSAQATPPGVSEVLQVSDAPAATLSHALYGNVGAAVGVVDWLEQVLEWRGRAAQSG
jgi:hypothetical protein